MKILSSTLGKIFLQPLHLANLLLLVSHLSFGDTSPRAEQGDSLQPLDAVPGDTAFRDLYDKIGRTLDVDLKTLFTKKPGVVLAIPRGRSLQSSNADLDSPRIVYAGSPPENELFMGYVAKTNQIEILSLNKTTGEMDTFIIKNFGPDLKPQLYRVDKNLCISCHQNGGAIFPRGPWTESTLNEGLNEEQARAIGTHAFEGNQLYLAMKAANKGSTKFYGIDIAKDISVTDPSVFDSSVRTNAKTLQLQRACRALCSENSTKCFAALLTASLSSLDSDQKKFFAEQINTKWPKDEFSYPSTVLPDRTPFLDADKGGTSYDVVITDETKYRNFLSARRERKQSQPNSDGTRTETDTIEFILGNPDDPGSAAARNIKAIEFAKNQSSIDPRWKHKDGISVTYIEEGTTQNITFLENLEGTRSDDGVNVTVLGVQLKPISPGDGTNADPRTTRPLVGHIPVSDAYDFVVSSAFGCLFSDEHRQLLNAFTPDQIKSAFSKLTVSKYERSWPKKRSLFVRDLLTALGAANIPAIDSSDLPLAAASEITREQTTLPTTAKTPLFVTYCSQCHTDDTYKKLPLNDMTDATKLDEKTRKEVLKKLCKHRMPPSRFPQPTDGPNGEREEMIKQISNGRGCTTD